MRQRRAAKLTRKKSQGRNSATSPEHWVDRAPSKASRMTGKRRLDGTVTSVTSHSGHVGGEDDDYKGAQSKVLFPVPF